MLRQLSLLLLGTVMVIAQRRLALPDPRSCANSKLKLLLLKNFRKSKTCKYELLYLAVVTASDFCQNYVSPVIQS